MQTPLPPAGMDAYTKDVIQVVFWFVAIVGAFIAAIKALHEMKQNREQRADELAQREKESALTAQELRWSQAKIAKELLDEMFEDPLARAAMTMLDWHGREFEIKKGVVAAISEHDRLHGLRTTNLGVMSDKDVFIRDSFDRFFYYVDRIEQSIRIKLVDFEDVKFPLDYYAEQMRPDREVYERFMKTYGYRLAAEFFDKRLDYSLEKIAGESRSSSTAPPLLSPPSVSSSQVSSPPSPVSPDKVETKLSSQQAESSGARRRD